MYIKRFQIKGNNIDEITNLISLDFKTISFNPTEKVFVFFSEKYYLRNNSQLMLCLIVNIENEEDCNIGIISGGGGAGLVGADLGAEGKRVKEAENMLKEICREKEWELSEVPIE